MPRMNVVGLIGRVIDNPTIRYTAKSVAIWRCLLRIDRPPSRKRHEPDKRYDEINIVVWGEQAEAAARHVQRGSLIGVSGWINSRRYTKKNHASQEERDRLFELLSASLGDTEAANAVMNEALNILGLDGKETSHVAYEVVAPEIEFLADCIFHENDKEMMPMIEAVRKHVTPEELEEFLDELGIDF